MPATLPSKPRSGQPVPTGWTTRLWEAVAALQSDVAALRPSRPTVHTGHATLPPFSVQRKGDNTISVGYQRGESHYPHADAIIIRTLTNTIVRIDFTSEETISVSSTGVIYYRLDDPADDDNWVAELRCGDPADDYEFYEIVVLGAVVYVGGKVIGTRQYIHSTPALITASDLAPAPTPTPTPTPTPSPSPTVPPTPTNEPDDFANLLMWLDADALTGLSDDDPLTTWTDESGNGNSPTGSGSTRPLYQTEIRNGRPAIYFDGTDDYLYKATSVIPSGGNWTMFIVAQTSAQWAPLSSNDSTSETSSADNSWRTVSHSSNFNNGAGWVGDAAIGGSDTSWHIFTFDRVASSTLRSWLDGVAGASHSYTWAHDDVSVGRFHNGGNYVYHAGYIAEIIVYDVKLTDDERDQVNAYLAAKWGISVS